MKKLLCLVLLGGSILSSSVFGVDILYLKELKDKCDKDDLVACAWLGAEYSRQDYVAKAKEYLIKSCKGGSDTGCSFLSDLHNEGMYDLSDILNDDFKPNNKYSYKTLKPHIKNCKKGLIDSCDILAYSYANGLGVKQDYAKAIKLLKKACDVKEWFSCYRLGFMYSQGIGVKQDYVKAKKYFEKWCHHSRDCENYEILKNLGY